VDVTALILLVEILEAGSLSEAARRLHMSRANVSYRLTQFERGLGQQLLRRTTRRIEATEIGQRLYEHGRAIQNELLAATESVALLGSSLQGRVRLSVPSGYGQLVMADWLIAFKRAHPGIVLDVMFENRVEDLMREEVDIAVRVMSEPPQNLVARDMGSVRYVACASNAWAVEHGMPAQLEDLRRVPLITSAVHGRQLRVSAYLNEERHEVLLEPTLISENFLFLRQSVLAGLGIGLVPDYVFKSELKDLSVVAALTEWRLSIFGTQMYMLYMPGRHRTRAIAAFIDFMMERAKKGEGPEDQRTPAGLAAVPIVLD